MLLGGIGGGEENDGDAVSSLRIASSETGASHGGGKMFALRWRFSSKASHKGIVAR